MFMSLAIAAALALTGVWLILAAARTRRLRLLALSDADAPAVPAMLRAVIGIDGSVVLWAIHRLAGSGPAGYAVRRWTPRGGVLVVDPGESLHPSAAAARAAIPARRRICEAERGDVVEYWI